ncbi:Calx-beta domain-containing protein [Aliikangiella coralliicola]|uniref:PKD domain-containing protein n=1 Tax=Aliikangiella coralliicola TaxID=2592383 RepID=A0A545UII1_9GAMM|nr:carboxypeptidase regulatory-like domain-containing protein [Aliikangiella coralliicola]TQV89265.1 PKD domain-containing protein [Aliikangiella coralliicola]
MKKVTTIGLVALSSVSIFANATDNVSIKKSVTMSAPVKVSEPLRELAKPLPTLSKERKFKLTSAGKEVPGYDKVWEVPNRFPFKDKDYKLPEGFVDPVAQTSLKKSKFKRQAPELGVSFDGVGNVTGAVPPDTNGDVGPNHYVQTVNVALAIWDKEGNQLMAPAAVNSLWSGFGGICETNNNGDPIVLYDGAADRWMISQFALNGTDNHQCIAVSTTGDPTGSYYLYDFAYGELMNDYPHFGVWTDGYYMGVNQFDSTAGFAWSGGGVVAYEREKMLIGAPAQQVKFDMNGATPTVYTPMPLDIDGITPPPADANQYFIWSSGDSGELDRLHVWEFDVDWDNTSASTFTPVQTVSVTPYGGAPAITQPNGQALDSLSIRSMFRAAYRNLNGQGKIVFTHNVAAPAGQGETALRWYEIDVDQSQGTVAVANEGTFAPDTNSRWMGSGAMDVNGNVAFGYSIASSAMVPSIAAATRLATDPANTLTDEIMLHNGEGSQSGASRWGDYSSLSIDPEDDCTFWFTTEYYKTDDDGSTAWSTRISSFKIPTCSSGPRGELTGKVTDTTSGEAIANATITIGLFTTKTDSEGNYRVTLPVGDYDVSGSKYGWVTSTAAASTVTEDETVTNNITLEGATPVVVSGKVSDGGGHGNSLYAKVSVRVPGDTLSTYTNPETGAYSISLFEGTTVSFSAEEIRVGGYLKSESTDVLPTNETNAQKDHTGVNFELTPNSNCTAPGYAFDSVDGFYEGFDVFPAAGWTVTDHSGEGVVWSSYVGSGRNISGAQGEAAFADSDAAGPGVNADTSLVSPVINVVDRENYILEFDGYLATWTGQDDVDIDVNVDSAGWTNVGKLSKSASLDSYALDITDLLTGATSFQVRFRYYNANWEFYTLIDNVRFIARTCNMVAGSMLTGYVTDANTGTAINGASISIDGNAVTASVATSEDEAINDGLFQVFVSDSATSIEVAKEKYVTATPTSADIALATPVSLNAGMINTDEVTFGVTEGRALDNSTLTISNVGTADASVSDLLLIKGGQNNLIHGPFHPSTRHFGPKDLNNLDTAKIRHFPDHKLAEIKSVEASSVFATDLTYGWSISRNRTTGEFWVGDLQAGGALADAVWKFDADGTRTTTNVAVGWGGSFHAGSAFNQRTGSLWIVNVGGDNCIHEVDIEALEDTGNTICPAFGTSQRGLAYDPITDTFYSGSWNDGIIHQFTMDGTIIRSVNVGLSVAGLAYNAETGHLFVSINNAGDNYDVVAVDAMTEGMDMLGGIDVQFDLDGDGYPGNLITSQAGLDIDCDGNLWIVDQAQQLVIGFASGETGACEWNNVPWMTAASIDPVTLAASETAESALTFDVANLAAGDYEATIAFKHDTPYSVSAIPLKVTVNEPSYGTAQFAVTHVDVDEEKNAVLSVERVDGSDYAVSVDFNTIDGSAIAGADYTATSGTLNWADGDTAAKTISVPTSALDVHKTFTVILSNPQGGAAVGAKTAATVTIIDQPKSGSGSFGAPLLMLFVLTTLFRRRKVSVK